MLLTSGTLSPMESFQQELLMDFPIRIENKHVIKAAQAKISVVPSGVMGTPFNFSHKHRENEKIFIDLGITLLKLCEITPGGVLVFFSKFCVSTLKNDFGVVESRAATSSDGKIRFGWNARSNIVLI